MKTKRKSAAPKIVTVEPAQLPFDSTANACSLPTTTNETQLQGAATDRDAIQTGIQRENRSDSARDVGPDCGTDNQGMDERRHHAGKCEGLPQCWYCQDERTGEPRSRSHMKHRESQR